MPELALAQVALQYLPLVIHGAEQLWAWIVSVRSAAQQTREWTDAMEAQFQAALLARSAKPEYQPDPE